MKHKVTRRMLIERFGTSMAVAKVLGITRGAVCAWKLDKPIPPMRLLQLQTLFPGEFGAPRPLERRGFWIEYRPDQKEARI